MDRNIQVRVQQMVDTLCGGNKSEFCRRIGRSAVAIKDIIGPKQNAPGYELIFDILASDLGISPKWLILGDGPMLENDCGAKTEKKGEGNNVVIIGNIGELKNVIADAIRENLK